MQECNDIRKSSFFNLRSLENDERRLPRLLRYRHDGTTQHEIFTEFSICFPPPHGFDDVKLEDLKNEAAVLLLCFELGAMFIHMTSALREKGGRELTKIRPNEGRLHEIGTDKMECGKNSDILADVI